MRNIYLIALTLLITFSCGKNSSKGSIDIHGEIKNFSKGTFYFMKHDYKKDSLFVIDSINIFGEKEFNLPVSINEVDLIWFSTTGKNENKTPLFVSDGGKYELYVNGEKLSNTVMIGSSTQDSFDQYQELSKNVNLKRYEMLNEKIQEANKNNVIFDIDGYINKTHKNFLLYKAQVASTKYNQTLIAPYIALYELSSYPALMGSIYTNLDPNIKELELGITLKSVIDEYKQSTKSN